MKIKSEGILNSPSNQKLIVKAKKNTCPNSGKYDPKNYPRLAYETLSVKHLQSLTHLANALDCTLQALVNWRKKYPDFNEMVEKGLKAGEEKFREKLIEHAFQPQSEVNNGLIKMLAGNVYGMREDVPTVVINNSTTINPAQALKDRGIPEPEIGISDIPSECESCDDYETCEELDQENCPKKENKC